MTKDTLFLLQGDFMRDLDGPFFCPDCIAIEGLISYFPRLREELDIVRLTYARPRSAIVDMLGEENQDSPCLVLAEANCQTKLNASARPRSSTISQVVL